MTDPAIAAPERTTPTCPNCGNAVAPTASFCEACGATLTPTVAEDSSEQPPDELESPITLSRPLDASTLETDPPDGFDNTLVVTRPCANCGGEIGSDGYCLTCGTKAPTERDHYTEHPASWVAACCDKGIRHFRNEDATAVAADPDGGGRAALVVCDGVSTSVDSDVASLAAARAARDVLMAHRPAGIGVPASRAAAIATSVEAAAAAARRRARSPPRSSRTISSSSAMSATAGCTGSRTAAAPESRESSVSTTRWHRPASPWASPVTRRRTGRKHTPSPSGWGGTPPTSSRVRVRWKPPGPAGLSCALMACGITSPKPASCRSSSPS